MNANTTKITKAQRANLVRIWTERTAFGLVAADRTYQTAIDAKTCAATGFGKMHRAAQASLISKGLARVLVTKTAHVSAYGTFYVQVLVLTDAGRKAVGV